MTRTSQSIRMLQLLNSRGLMSKDELAYELKTNRRNIVEYKKELEDAGYDIQSISGRYGGYILNGAILLPVLSLNQKENKALAEAFKYMKSQPDFLMLKELQDAMDKISTQIEGDHRQGIYMNQVETMVSSKMKKMIMLCEEARDHQKIVKIKYKGMNDTIPNEIHILPYEILHYHNAYYCLAYSLAAKDFRNYKFSEERLKNLQLTDASFNRDADFHLHQHIGKLGLMKDDVHEFELLIFDQQALLVSERKIGIHPQMEWREDHVLYLKTIMEGKLDVISFILSLGEHAIVLSPKSLKKEIAEIINSMYKRYFQK